MKRLNTIKGGFLFYHMLMIIKTNLMEQTVNCKNRDLNY